MTARLPILIGTGLTVGAVVLTASVVADRHKVSPPDAEILAEGRVIYEAECAACHGAELEGQLDWRSPLPSGRLPAPPHDATGRTWHHPDEVLFRIVKEGTAAIVGGGYESDMPGFGDVLSDAEVRAVLASRALGQSASAATRRGCQRRTDRSLVVGCYSRQARSQTE